jgi:hypothetical protein
MNLFLLKAKRNKSPFFPPRQPAHTHHTQKPKALGLRFTKGKTMPLPNSQGPLSPFVLQLLREKA